MIVPIASPTSGREAGPVAVDDVVSERLAQPGGVFDGGDAVGVPEVAVGGAGGVGDAEPAGVGADLFDERSRRRRRPVRVTDGGSAGCVEECGAVADGAAEGVFDVAAGGDVAVLGSKGVAGAGWFERVVAGTPRPGSAASRRGRCRARTAPCRTRTAAAEPPLDPLVDSSGFQGLRVGPNRTGSQAGARPNSGALVLPRITRAAAWSRRTSSWSKVETLPARNLEPSVNRTPRISHAKSFRR